MQVAAHICPESYGSDDKRKRKGSEEVPAPLLLLTLPCACGAARCGVVV